MPFGTHETLELLEIATFKTIALTKSKTMQALASDDELKRLMRQDADLAARHLEQIGTLLGRAAEQEVRL